MPSFVGPSHFLFYGALYRRRLWLAHLVQRLEQTGYAPEWPAEHEKLEQSYPQTFARLPIYPHLGIVKPLRLDSVLDDTPIDSFLMNLSEELDGYEHALFRLMEKHGRSSPKGASWLEELEQASTLWGRQLAQECLIANPRLLPEKRAVRGLFEAFHIFLEGGDFTWRPLLLRRYTPRELEYEVRNCPHRKKSATPLACRLESMVYRGFVQALLPESSFQRITRQEYCLDQIL